jgi:DNA-binding response OmpR family regulator
VIGRSRVLLADPDAGIRRLIQRRLKTYRCVCAEAATLPETLSAVGQWRPDAIVLAADLRGAQAANGLAVLREIKAVANDAAILCLVAQGMVDSVSLLLDQGADDCLIKPFLGSELGARLHRLLHRQDIVAGQHLLRGTGLKTLKLVPQGGYVETDRGRALLTVRQVTLLATLIGADGATVRSDRLIEAVWGDAHAAAPQSLHRSIAVLRQKIEVDPVRPVLIVTMRGVGYRFGGVPEESRQPWDRPRS